MTHHTDAEQLHQLLELVLTELDRKAIPIAYMQEIDRKGKAFIEQAARRAPVVPQRCDLCKNNGGYFYGRTGYEPCCVGSLAPQPPDAAPVQMPEYGIDTANHAGIRVRGYTEQQVRELLAAQAAVSNGTLAAPVQLPEPQAEIEVRSMKTYLDLSIHEWRDTLPDGAYNIYTEQQLRELLAAHGIQERST